MAFKDKSQAIRYQNEYNRAKYDRVTIMLDKGGKEALQTAAKQAGQSVNEFVKQSISDRLAKLQDDHKGD